MTTRDTPWPDGTPCWCDCMVDDLDAARAFYSELFGWEILDSPPEAGGYLMAMKRGRPAAGIGPKPEGFPMPSVWTTYLATCDVDKTAAAVVEAGGSIMMEPFDVLDVGRMTVGADGSGAVFGLWQPGTHFGSGIVNEPGAHTWNDLHSSDYESAKAFFGGLFGYSFNEMGDGGMTYTTFSLPGSEDSVGGMMLDTMKPDDMPDYWLAWFGVEDCDAAVETATRLGASLMMPPSDSPFGRMAVFAAPQGEVLGVIGLGQATPDA